MSFSSFPGGIQSGDDFYLISSGLTTMETTNNNYNDSLWSNVKPVGQVYNILYTYTNNILGLDSFIEAVITIVYRRYIILHFLKVYLLFR